MDNKHFRQALALIRGSEKQLKEIESQYNSCLKKKEIDDDLLVVIKNYLENLRSALEYSAQGLNEKYGSCKDKTKISFPYAKLTVTKEVFVKRNYIQKLIPGLGEKRPDIVKFITDMQHFSHPGSKWFPAFMSLTNTNKHIELTPHEKFEGAEMRAGGSIIVAQSFGGTGSYPKDAIFSDWDAFLIKGVEWPMTAIEFLRHCGTAIGTIVRQISEI